MHWSFRQDLGWESMVILLLKKVLELLLQIKTHSSSLFTGYDRKTCLWSLPSALVLCRSRATQCWCPSPLSLQGTRVTDPRQSWRTQPLTPLVVSLLWLMSTGHVYPSWLQLIGCHVWSMEPQSSSVMLWAYPVTGVSSWRACTRLEAKNKPPISNRVLN